MKLWRWILKHIFFEKGNKTDKQANKILYIKCLYNNIKTPGNKKMKTIAQREKIRLDISLSETFIFFQLALNYGLPNINTS